MIEFACKKISREDIIRCSFGLNKTGYDVLMFLLDREEELTVSQIARKMGLDRTTVQKAVQKLLEEELVKREKKGLEEGGYTFLYQTKAKKIIKKEMIRKVKEWSQAVIREIKNV